MIEISVLIVVRNEERYIIDCIQSIESQFDKEDQWELIIIDGESTDKTKELTEQYLQKVDYSWQLLNNPKKTLAPGWNLGIMHAKGSYVLRPDAHATLHDNYIKIGLETIKNNNDITAVGGVLETKSKNYWGNIIRVALSSKVGVGNSSFRTASQSGFADTAVYAVYRKAIFDKVGLFNEKLVRHQDNDMHQRIKSVGGRFYLNIDMKADYYCRDQVSSLSKQMFNIGRYLPDVMFSGALSPRHFIPFVFYLGLLIGFLLGVLIHPIFSTLTLAAAALYFAVIIIETISKTIRLGDLNMLFLLIIIPLIHLNYAAGTFLGLISKPFRN